MKLLDKIAETVEAHESLFMVGVLLLILLCFLLSAVDHYFTRAYEQARGYPLPDLSFQAREGRPAAR